jgi:hypothetical protein
MEKAAVFSPLIIFFGIFALLIIFFIRFIFKLIAKSKNEDWIGEVIDKKINTYEDDDTGMEKDSYYLVVKMEAGRDRNIALSRERWDSFSVGDKIHKPKGKLYPEKI